MKTTVEIPDSLFRQAKVKAALDGRKMKDLVAEGLALVLAGPAAATIPSSTSGDLAGSERDAASAVPSWYGAFAPYARRAGAASDMKAMRASIGRGIVAERGL